MAKALGVAAQLLRHLSGDGKRVVAVIQAYLDEGGTHAGAERLAVAGFYGDQSQWDIYLDAWKYDEFHACESRFDRIKVELCQAIENARLGGVEAFIRPAQFDESASHEVRSSIGNAYAVAAFACAMRICQLAVEDDEDARIAFVLEDGQPNVEWVQRMLISLIGHWPIASVTVARKKDFTQLHAADFLAHSRAINDTVWMNRLFATGRVWEQKFDSAIWRSVSSQVKSWLREYRNQKLKARRERKFNVARVQEVRRDNGETTESSTQRDQGQAGRGESGEGGKKAEG